jgi:8-amino-7-oxononanoate synthase
MNSFEDILQRELEDIREQGLLRELRRVDSAQGPMITIAGQRLLNFSSNDYLGLANAPAVQEAVFQTVKDFGAGSGASRLICGSLATHHALEEALAEFKATAACLVFSSGYATAVGTIAALLGHDDVIVVDRLVHACIIDAAKLCGARLRVFPHNDMAGLERVLRWARQRPTASAAKRSPRVLVVTESVFSMDGDRAKLADIIALKDQYGAWLMLDEAHATGLIGQNRRGLADALSLAEGVEIQMGTLGKALGAAGGYICGSRKLVDLLINRARSFIFSTAPTPANSAAALAAVHLVQGLEGANRCRAFWARVDQLRSGLAGQTITNSIEQSSGIVPLILGAEARALHAARQLFAQGFLVPAIRYPTVARGSARLRLTVTSDHQQEDVSALLQALAQLSAPR